MNKTLTLMAVILATLYFTSSSFALPTRIYTELPNGTYGRYYPDSNAIRISRKIPEDMIQHVIIHETAHWFDMEKKTPLRRMFWKRAFEREQYQPTEYCRNTKRHKVEECYAETLTRAVLYNLLPPARTTTHRIIKIDREVFLKLLNE